LLYLGNNYNNGLNGNNNLDNNAQFLGITQTIAKTFIMKTYRNFYSELTSFENIFLAYKKARKHKSTRNYVIEFEKDLLNNILKLKHELETCTYTPEPLKTFILRDPKTRKISKSEFRDRIVHHALFNVLEPIYEKRFIYDSCANRKNKGNLFAIRRFYKFLRKVTKNGTLTINKYNNNSIISYCLKADIKHYFETVDQQILLKIIKRKVKDEKVIWLTEQILINFNTKIKGKGMPLGNLTSQFFANIYLNELDYFIKHNLRIKYYIRYVDDFVILHESYDQLLKWKGYISGFLIDNLKIELHKDKSRIIPLSRGIDFIGFRNFYYYKLLRNRNVRKMKNKIRSYKEGIITKDKITESFQGWQAYAKWASTYKLRKNLEKTLNYFLFGFFFFFSFSFSSNYFYRI